jgi:hypothetical protein
MNHQDTLRAYIGGAPTAANDVVQSAAALIVYALGSVSDLDTRQHLAGLAMMVILMGVDAAEPEAEPDAIGDVAGHA